MQRLAVATLAGTHPDRVPPTDRNGPAAVVHLGVGAFMRAHLATYAEDLLRLGWPARIHGISLRSADAERRLAPQDGLFTLTVLEPDEVPAPRVVGSLVRVSTGPAAAIAAIAAAETRLVTLTVTEKGYRDEATTPAVPSVPAVIADGLARRDRTLAAPVFAPLDNVSSNGDVLRAAVLARAADHGRGLADWVGDEVRFATSVVDRMVPATTPEDVAVVEVELGLRDEAAVVCERHRSWAIARSDGLPPLEDVGVTVTGDIAEFERRKLRLLNGPHSALAYAGLLCGCTTIAEAAVHPLAGGFASRIAEAAIDVVDPSDRHDARSFAATSLRRFRNPALEHRCLQVGADGSEKLRQRVLPVVGERAGRGLGLTDHATLFAAWLAAVVGLDVATRPLPTVADPRAEALRSAWDSGGAPAVVGAALGTDAPPGFADLVEATLRRLGAVGPRILGSAP